MEIFQTFAEISIGILGFTSIMLMIKHQHSDWNDNMYRGLIGHSVQVLAYSLLPFILEAYHCQPTTIYTVGSIVLGTFTTSQGIGVFILDKKASLQVRLLMLFFSTTVGVLQLLNILGIGTDRESAPYILGISWHVFQSLVIFSMLVAKRMDNDPKTPT